MLCWHDGAAQHRIGDVAQRYQYATGIGLSKADRLNR